MTNDAALSTLKHELRTWFDAWKTCIQDVLSQVSGQPNTFETVFEPLPSAESDPCYTLVATGSVQGEMAVRFSVSSGLRLACKFLGEPEPAADKSAEVITDEKREALEELLRQIGGLAATSVAGISGGQVQFRLSRGEAPWSAKCDHVATLRTRDDAGTEIALEIRISPALVTALELRASIADKSSITSPHTPQAASAAPSSSREQQPLINPVSSLDPPAAGYGRLLGVELEVKLRFGTRSMLLRDVLALSSGLVVELDNELNSPVDLLLDGRVIARGDVVVIDGKYGLRVTDVLDSSATAP
jgi:flagellar motor switch protein FliN